MHAAMHHAAAAAAAACRNSTPFQQLAYDLTYAPLRSLQAWSVLKRCLRQTVVLQSLHSYVLLATSFSLQPGTGHRRFAWTLAQWEGSQSEVVCCSKIALGSAWYGMAIALAQSGHAMVVLSP